MLRYVRKATDIGELKLLGSQYTSVHRRTMTADRVAPGFNKFITWTRQLFGMFVGNSVTGQVFP